MKMKTLKLLLLLTIIILPGCTYKKSLNTLFYYEVAHECLDMGIIKGEALQNPLVDDYTTEIEAISLSQKYRFVKWNDGLTNAKRKDKANGEPKIVYVAYFEVIDE